MTQNWKKLYFILAAVCVLLFPPVRRCAAAALLALLSAGAVSRPVAWLEKHSVPRWLGVSLVLGGAVSLITAVLLYAGCKLCSGITCLTQCFPNPSALFRRLEDAAAFLPASLQTLAESGLSMLQQQSAALPDQLASYAAKLSAKLFSSLPEKAFFLLIVLLASFYAAFDWPRLKKQLSSWIPEDWSRQAGMALHSLRVGAAGWLKAQGRLLLIQCVLLTAGLLLLGIKGAVFLGALVALADALPLFGSGTVLLPWAGLLWLEGKNLCAAGLAVLWLASWLSRTVLEPRFMGHQAGISPFFTLLAMYLGLCSFGFWGLIAAPVVLAAGMQLFRSRQKEGHSIPVSKKAGEAD